MFRLRHERWNIFANSLVLAIVWLAECSLIGVESSKSWGKISWAYKLICHFCQNRFIFDLFARFWYFLTTSPARESATSFGMYDAPNYCRGAILHRRLVHRRIKVHEVFDCSYGLMSPKMWISLVRQLIANAALVANALRWVDTMSKRWDSSCRYKLTD
jgi:hypothetical protein